MIIYLETGKMHQIKAHFEHIGRPLVRGILYGTDEENHGHQMLYCYQVTFIPPTSKERIMIIVPMPEDMQRLSGGI